MTCGLRIYETAVKLDYRWTGYFRYPKRYDHIAKEKTPKRRHLFLQQSSRANRAGRVWKNIVLTWAFLNTQRVDGEDQIRGWLAFLGQECHQAETFEHGAQALPVDPAGGRPVTGGTEGLEHLEDPGRHWWRAT